MYSQIPLLFVWCRIEKASYWKDYFSTCWFGSASWVWDAPEWGLGLYHVHLIAMHQLFQCMNRAQPTLHGCNERLCTCSLFTSVSVSPDTRDVEYVPGTGENPLSSPLLDRAQLGSIPVWISSICRFSSFHILTEVRVLSITIFYYVNNQYVGNVIERRGPIWNSSDKILRHKINKQGGTGLVWRKLRDFFKEYKWRLE